MESSELPQNHSHSVRKNRKPLVIRVHLNKQYFNSPQSKSKGHEINTVSRSSRSKSASKRRPSSWKMFAGAHSTEGDETFLINSKKQKQNFKFKGMNLKSSLKTNPQSHYVLQSEHKLMKGAGEQIRKLLINSEKIDQHKLKNIIKKVQQNNPTKNHCVKDLISEISKVIYGEEGASFQDKSFEFIDESTIHGEEDFLYVHIDEHQAIN